MISLWNKNWDNIFTETDWGKYPCEELIRFVARNFFGSPKREEVKILEIGCGTGGNLWFLTREGFDVTGIDGSSVGVEKAEKRLTKNGLSASLHVGDVMELPWDADLFDCVIDNECIYSNTFADSLKIINEVKRVLKPGGLFYSKTFMTGTSGDGMGDKLEGEKNTYTKLHGGALRTNYGVVRFTEEAEIDSLYGVFNIESIDFVNRSDKNRANEIKEWIIICRKTAIMDGA